MTDLFQSTCPCCGQTIHQEAQKEPFAAFWAEVPHKIAKSAAGKAWRKLAPADRAEAKRLVKRFYSWFAKTYPGASPIHPASYINGRRWEDVSSQSVASSADANEALRVALRSTVPAVRDHAEHLCRRRGINPDELRNGG